MSYLLPLGPFHYGWQSPIRVVLTVEGERIEDVEYRDGYQGRSIQERLGRSSLPQALHIVRHLCAQDSVAHTLAFCQALEQLGRIPIHERGVALRMIAAEVERAMVHVSAMLQVYQALGLDRDSKQLKRLQTALYEVQHHLTGSSLQPDYVLPGGVRQDLPDDQREKMAVHLRSVERIMYRFIDRFIDHRGILRRTVGTSVLAREAGEQFGIRGMIARAAGIPYDTRVDRPYALYDQYVPSRITQEHGDVYGRMVVMTLEAFESLKLILRMLSDLPRGEWLGSVPASVPEGSATTMVESARGMLRYTIRSNGVRLTDVHIDAPRQFDRLLARTFLAGMAVDDAGLIIASLAPCLACAEG